MVRSSSTCSSMNHWTNWRVRLSFASRAALASASNCAVTLASLAWATSTASRADP